MMTHKMEAREQKDQEIYTDGEVLTGIIPAMEISVGVSVSAPAADVLTESVAAYSSTDSTDSMPLDINSLVQEVMREAYQQQTEDLQFYAEKVQQFNEVKSAIRDELTAVREKLSGLGNDSRPEQETEGDSKIADSDDARTTDSDLLKNK